MRVCVDVDVREGRGRVPWFGDCKGTLTPMPLVLQFHLC